MLDRITKLVIFAITFGLLSAYAQTNPGRISGTITDSSGAAVPGARVNLTNEATALKWTAVTDTGGFYLVTNLPVGNYDVEAEATGFRKAEKKGYDLADDGRITADFALQVGSLNESVQVTAVAGETVNTVSGEISRTIDAEQVQDLALNGRNYMQLVSLIPGVALTSLDQMALTTSLSVGNQSINGNRTDSNHLMVDGGMNLDSGSNTSQINNVGVDFIQEVKVQTSAFSAQYGRNSGGSINVVTKSGGDHFHGSLFETIRNDYLDAKDYFAPVKPELRFNDFGWSLGGPIAFGPLKKGKLFIFGGQEWKRIRRFTNPSRQTLPTLAEIAGDFSGRPTATINFPGTKTPIPNKDLSNLMTADGRAIMNVYGAMIKYAARYTNTPTTNNTTFQVFNPFDFREDILRLDWRPSEKHLVYFRYIHDNYNVIDPFGSFTASALPTTPTQRNRPGYGPQLSYTWIISPTLLNEAKINSSWNGQRTPLQGTNWQRNTYGFQFPRTFGGNGEYPGGIPDVSVNNFASFNGPARVYLASPTTDIAISDNFSYIHDTHAIKAGVSVIRNRKDQNGRTVYDGSAAFNTTGNTNTTGFSLADAALGQFQTYTEAGSDPQGLFRFTQIEAYIEDTWRVSRSLSIAIGMRYSYFTPIYTTANNIVNFVPSLYDPAKAVTLTPGGLIVPGSGNPLNGLIRAGDGVPAGEAGRVPGATDPATLAVPAGAPRGLYNPANLLMPRFSFAWTPFGMQKLVVRGGFGSFHDRTQGNLIFPQTNLPPYSYQVQFQNGNLANPSGATAAALGPQGTIHGLDPNLKVPVTYTYNFGIQRELPKGMLLSVDYAGHVSRHLFRSPNINEPSFAALLANLAIPSAQRPVTNSIVPYLGYSTINEFLSDSNDNYNALQTYLTKRKGNTVMTVSYTWSKALTDASSYNSAGDVIEGLNRRFNYGPASYDRRHIFVATYTYRLPVLGDHNAIVRGVLGGWEISGITRLQSGALLTPTGASYVPGNRRSEYLGGPVALPTGQRGPNRWFNTEAFSNALPAELGNAGVGIIQGPGWENWDLSLRKVFRIRERFAMRFTADSFNVMNHVNFDDPNVTTSSTSFGTISSAQPARNIQFGLHLTF
jgi:Carboxypeptidase regulatory-like domain/TonB-dependent Receptor Plug Domain